MKVEKAEIEERMRFSERKLLASYLKMIESIKDGEWDRFDYLKKDVDFWEEQLGNHYNVYMNAIKEKAA